VLVVNGDVPLVSKGTLTTFLTAVERSKSPLGFITLTLNNPGAYGRVLRDDGVISAVIEVTDYDSSIYGPAPNEINVGIYCLELDRIEPLLPLLKIQGGSECYITELIALAVDADMDVLGVPCGNDVTLLGVNTPQELIRSEDIVREEIIRSWMEEGVFIHDAGSVRIGPNVAIEPGARIQGPCAILGTSHIAANAEIQAFCHVNNTVIGENAVVRSFSHLENAVLEAGAIAGPYARLRPGAYLEASSQVGNFVEVKNATLGRGAKANHLSYLGDASIGEGANIGAGTITCNYDGYKKHRTSIGPNSFIGSHTALVAPVNVGENSIIGAGSTITKDVPDNTLALSRPEQISKVRRAQPEKNET
jgi:bifunctional UDP-N-acetylglucosamine pyrophosphorylase/glucosamine-1-phosphate N-acetyltransferase